MKIQSASAALTRIKENIDIAYDLLTLISDGESLQAAYDDGSSYKGYELIIKTIKVKVYDGISQEIDNIREALTVAPANSDQNNDTGALDQPEVEKAVKSQPTEATTKAVRDTYHKLWTLGTMITVMQRAFDKDDDGTINIAFESMLKDMQKHMDIFENLDHMADVLGVTSEDINQKHRGQARRAEVMS